jgi:hypothetical protein
VAPIYDLKIKNTDLILATHGRGFWIAEDLPLLYQYAEDPAAAVPAAAGTAPAAAFRLFAPRRTWRILPDLFADWTPAEGRIYGMLGSTLVATKSPTGQTTRAYLDAGEGATRGALIHFYLAAAPAEDTPATLEILDAGGNVLRTYGRKPQGYDKFDEARKGLDPGPWLPLAGGINTFVWNLRLAGAVKVPGNKTAGEALEGPWTLPGSHTVRLTVGGQVQTQLLEVLNDPRVQTPPEDLVAQQELLIAIRDKISAIHTAILRARDVRRSVEAWQKRLTPVPANPAAPADPAHAAALTACSNLLGALTPVEDALYLPGDHKMTYGLIVRPRLNQVLASTIPVIASADAKPTTQVRDLVAHYFAAIDGHLATLDDLLIHGVAGVNAAIAATGLPPIP